MTPFYRLDLKSINFLISKQIIIFVHTKKKKNSKLTILYFILHNNYDLENAYLRVYSLPVENQKLITIEAIEVHVKKQSQSYNIHTPSK